MNVSEALDTYKILEYSVFEDSAQQTIIAADGFESYDNILMLGDSYFVNLLKGLSDSNVATGKISFILRWTNILKATINCAQEFRRISQTSSLIFISNAVEFRASIELARQRYMIRKYSLEESASLSKAANPGNLKLHKYWITWSR